MHSVFVKVTQSCAAGFPLTPFRNRIFVTAEKCEAQVYWQGTRLRGQKRKDHPWRNRAQDAAHASRRHRPASSKSVGRSGASLATAAHGFAPLLLDGQQFYFKNESHVGPELVSGSPFPVRELGWNEDLPLGAHGHELQGFAPASDDAALFIEKAAGFCRQPPAAPSVAAAGAAGSRLRQQQCGLEPTPAVSRIRCLLPCRSLHV